MIRERARHAVRLLSAAVLLTFLSAPSLGKIKPVMEPSPELLATHGFVVGTLVGGNGDAGKDFPKTFTLAIDDSWVTVPFVGRTFMVAVTPGPHVLHQARQQFGKDDYVSKKKVFRTFALGTRFTVEVGKITTLGAMYLYEKDAAPDDMAAGKASGKYIVLPADNGRFIEEFVQRRHGEIYAGLADKSLHPAYPLLNDTQYKALHQIIARARLREKFQGATRFGPNSTYLVFGDLGMAGYVYTDKSGVPARFRSFGLDTFETVTDCHATSKRHVCVTQTEWGSGWDRRVFLGTEGRAERLTLPEGASPIAAHLMGTDGLILGDYNYRLHVRTRALDPWQVVQRDGIKAGAFVAKYVFGDGPTGIYTYYEGNEHALTLTDTTSGATTTVELPPKFKGGAKVLHTAQHLLIGPEWNLVAASEVYLRNHQTGEWVMSKLPVARCDWMGLDVKDSSRLLAACGTYPGTLYVSVDDGMTWRLDSN